MLRVRGLTYDQSNTPKLTSLSRARSFVRSGHTRRAAGAGAHDTKPIFKSSRMQTYSPSRMTEYSGRA